MRRPLTPPLAAALATCAALAVASAACGNGGATPGPHAGETAPRTTPQAASDDEPPAPDPDATPVWSYRVVAAYPHDRYAFTQGLVFANGRLFESTGGYGVSDVREVELGTGRVVRQRRLEPRLFGEGLIARDGQLVQLTWQQETALVYDAADLRPLFRESYTGEGWGLAFDGQRLILSDGTPRLRFLHPDSFAQLGTLDVTDQGKPVSQLNELEWVDGALLANVWHSDRIARIDVATGKVTAWIDLAGIIDVPPTPPSDPQNVLNGIAWDAAGKRLFVTGKNWPKLFHVELVPPK